MDIEQHHIDEFWSWFATNVEKICDELTDDEKSSSRLSPALAELDRLVHRLHKGFSWEIGPEEEGRFLAISPSGSKERLPLTERIVATAPEIPGWIFHSAKPAKDWKRRFGYAGRRIDVSDWKYGLVKWSDPTAYGITWVATHDYGLKGDELDSLGRFVLMGELGEKAAINHFEGVEVKTADEWDDSLPLNRIDVLRDHMRSLLDKQRADP